VKKEIQREGSKCRETTCCLDEQRTGGERRVVLFGGKNKITGLLLACCRSMEEFREISSCC
jgi:hypothetical protein